MITRPRAIAKRRTSVSLRFFGLVVTALLAAMTANAQAPQPSPTAIAAAKELIEAKGSTNIFDPVVPGVIETAKNMFLRTNPSLSKDLNDVAAVLRNEFAAKRTEIANEVARTYAQRFTEQELKDAVAFYKTPLGKKITTEEPRILEQSMTNVQTWAERFSDEVVARVRAEMKKRGHNI